MDPRQETFKKIHFGFQDQRLILSISWEYVYQTVNGMVPYSLTKANYGTYMVPYSLTKANYRTYILSQLFYYFIK